MPSFLLGRASVAFCLDRFRRRLGAASTRDGAPCGSDDEAAATAVLDSFVLLCLFCGDDYLRALPGYSLRLAFAAWELQGRPTLVRRDPIRLELPAIGILLQAVSRAATQAAQAAAQPPAQAPAQAPAQPSADEAGAEAGREAVNEAVAEAVECGASGLMQPPKSFSRSQLDKRLKGGQARCTGCIQQACPGPRREAGSGNGLAREAAMVDTAADTAAGTEGTDGAEDRTAVSVESRAAEYLRSLLWTLTMYAYP